MKDLTDLIGRVLVALIFIYEAYDSIFYFKDTKQTMAAYGITWQQDLLLYASIVLLVVGGILLLIGYRSSFGALLLLLYWIPVTFIVHSFWNDPVEQQRLQAILFMKNLGIAGGLLLILVYGSGRFSVRRLFATARVPGA